MPLALKPTRPHAIVAGGLVLLVSVLSIACGVARSIGVHARLDLSRQDHVRILDPITVKFDQDVDLSRTAVTITPGHDVGMVKGKTRLIIAPAKPWDVATSYTISLGDVPSANHSGIPLKRWHASFTTQPKVGVAGFKVGSTVIQKEAKLAPNSKLGIFFTTAMRPASTMINVNGQPAAQGSVLWAPDAQSATLTLFTEPYQTVRVEVTSGESETGDALSSGGVINVQTVALEPSNPASGITAGFKTLPPIMVVVENSGPSRPQTGLQAADMVYEYISEYSITRMTAIYFNNPPPLIGPVRSCRMINPYLGFAFGGETMCSGGSIGTLHYMFLDPWLVPGSINDFDRGNHFFRVDFKGGPHNLYTEGSRGVRLRDEWHLQEPNYLVDPPHDDVDMGQPADSPSIPPHSAGWSYDEGSHNYLRFDHGTPFVDTGSNQQIHAKNVVLLHVPYHGAGWVEDDNGGAGSIWYDMLGSGPAEIYSKGKVVNAVWHMGGGQVQPYYDNHNPVYFTDEDGKVIELNSGLTWIHVVANGQAG